MGTYGIYYNQALCSGCKTCQVACKDKNKSPLGVSLRTVRTYEVGVYPNVKVYHYSAGCNHCDDPVCLKNCPVGAITKMEDGTVVQDHSLCIGCRSCVRGCPYGAPQFDEVEGLTHKCDGCYDLRQQGYQPACVEACPYRALECGDMEELEAKYPDAVRDLPAMERDENAYFTGPNTLIHAKSVAAEQLGRQFVV